jgi:glycosyltransferase involved in cell wall biosynthesis
MKVLYVISGNSTKISPFIKEQTQAISKNGIEMTFFFIEGQGMFGYLKNLKRFYNKIRTTKPDIVHAHYGLSGLFANLQLKVPVITTFHGTDINNFVLRQFSIVALLLSKYSIFVSEALAKKVNAKENYAVIPCGVNPDLFFPIDKVLARQKLGFKQDEKLILFSNSFDIHEKNYPLAQSAVDLLDGDIKLIELKGYSREEVNLLMNACDVSLMTSFSEGSPQFIKEAMACNCPIVSTDVGDVKSVIKNTDGCYITSFEVKDVVLNLNKALAFKKRTNGIDNVGNLMNDIISKKIIEIYKKI